MSLQNKRPRILCIDPGKAAGYSVSENDRIVDSGLIDGSIDNVHSADKLIKSIKPKIITVETQFFYGGRKSKGLIALIERQAMWKVLGKLRNITVCEVDPAQWQSFWDLFADKKISNKYKRRKNFKKKVITLAKFLIDHKDSVEDNEADAILMNLFVIDDREFLKNA